MEVTSVLEFTCRKSAKQIAKINFADYGNPIGECEDFRRDKAQAHQLPWVSSNMLAKLTNIKNVLWISEQ